MTDQELAKELEASFEIEHSIDDHIAELRKAKKDEQEKRRRLVADEASAQESLPLRTPPLKKTNAKRDAHKDDTI